MPLAFRHTAPAFAIALLTFGAAVVAAQGQPGRQSPRARITIIDSVTIVHAEQNRVTAGQRIVIRGDTILAVEPVSSPLPATVDEQINAHGAFAIPGLTDHHVHLTEGMSRSLTQAARGGVTMVQALAGDNRVAGEYARMVIAREIAAPEISYASVMAGPDFFTDPRFIGAGRGYTPGLAPWAQAVTDKTDVVVAVALARGSGAEVLKLYAMMDSTLVARLTKEAHRQGMTVVAHGTVFPARPLQLVQAGVDILTHAPYLSWQGATTVRAEDSWKRAEGPYDSVPVAGAQITALVDAMKRAGTVLEPTLWVFGRRTTETAMNDWANALTKKAAQAGVPVIAGTDGLIDADSTALPNVHRELQFLVNAGLSPAAALVAATSATAKAMHRATTHGKIAAGFVADIVLLDANPLQDISNTTHIQQVMLRGRLLKR